jgi:hypothetical protein
MIGSMNPSECLVRSIKAIEHRGRAGWSTPFQSNSKSSREKVWGFFQKKLDVTADSEFWGGGSLKKFASLGSNPLLALCDVGRFDR